MSAHRLWAGAGMILAAALTETIVGGSWSLAVLVAIVILLLVL